MAKKSNTKSSIISNVQTAISTSSSTVINDSLTQFYLYNGKSEIKSWKEQYIKQTCSSNYSRWSKNLNKIYICKRSDFQNLQLSPHYKVSDYCKGSGNTLLVCMETIQILETIWNYFGKQVNITSGYRDPSYNRRVGGAKGSMHMWGLAVDMKVPGLTAQVVGEFIAHYFKDCEIGVYGQSDMRNSGNWVHVAPRGGYSDYNKRIKGTEIFRQYKSANSPDEPVIYSDNIFGSPTSYVGGGSSFGGTIVDENGNIISGYSQPVSIDYTKLNPYVVTITRNINPSDIDTDKLKENGVIGFMIEGGSLFSQNHVKHEYFRNPIIDEQIKLMDENNIPFGLYMYARATSIEEVDEEIYEFSFLVRKYPPMFGAWLILNLGDDKNANGILIKRYQKNLERLGLKGKIGFYVKEKQLEQIYWEEFQNDWYLWIIKHVDDISEIDKLLDPEFFDMDGENPPADWVSFGINGYSGGGVGGSDGMEKFISVAQSHIGADGHDWVIKTAGIPKNLGWCAATMFAVAKECGYAGVIFPGESDGNRWSADPTYGFVPAIYNTYGGQRIDGTPQRGDLFQRIGSPHNHVGLVIEVNASEGTMKTIEGNTGTRINGERQLKSNNKKITDVTFFARPDWSKVSSTSVQSVGTTVTDIVSEGMSSAVEDILEIAKSSNKQNKSSNTKTKNSNTINVKETNSRMNSVQSKTQLNSWDKKLNKNKTNLSPLNK